MFIKAFKAAFGLLFGVVAAMFALAWLLKLYANLTQ